MADISRDSDEIELASPPRFAYGERVIARSVVRNDGTYNGCDIGDKRVDGVVQVKGYDRSPPNKSERVAK